MSFITPFSIPIIGALAMDHFMGNNTQFHMPIIKTNVQLLVIIIVPVSLGMFSLSRWPNFASKVETFIKWFSVLFIGYHLAKWATLSHPQAITIGFEVDIQKGTLAMVVAGTLIGNGAMMIPAVTYGLLMFITGAGFSGWVQKRVSTEIKYD